MDTSEGSYGAQSRHSGSILALQFLIIKLTVGERRYLPEHTACNIGDETVNLSSATDFYVDRTLSQRRKDR
jgi:hypothetical protein